MFAHTAQFVADLAARENSATIVTLSGDLGAGKTTFAQGIARALGVEEVVTSPTFVIEKVYELVDDGAATREAGSYFPDPNDRRKRENNFPPRASFHWARLIHIDAYRLKDVHELEVLGWHDIAADPGNLILIEWPEMVAELIPADAIRVTLNGSGDTREILYGKENN